MWDSEQSLQFFFLASQAARCALRRGKKQIFYLRTVRNFNLSKRVEDFRNKNRLLVVGGKLDYFQVGAALSLPPSKNTGCVRCFTGFIEKTWWPTFENRTENVAQNILLWKSDVRWLCSSEFLNSSSDQRYLKIDFLNRIEAWKFANNSTEFHENATVYLPLHLFTSNVLNKLFLSLDFFSLETSMYNILETVRVIALQPFQNYPYVWSNFKMVFGSWNPKFTLKVNGLWIKIKVQNFASQLLSKHTFIIWRQKGCDFFFIIGALTALTSAYFGERERRRLTSFLMLALHRSIPWASSEPNSRTELI